MGIIICWQSVLGSLQERAYIYILKQLGIHLFDRSSAGKDTLPRCILAPSISTALRLLDQAIDAEYEPANCPPDQIVSGELDANSAASSSPSSPSSSRHGSYEVLQTFKDSGASESRRKALSSFSKNGTVRSSTMAYSLADSTPVLASYRRYEDESKEFTGHDNSAKLTTWNHVGKGDIGDVPRMPASERLEEWLKSNIVPEPSVCDDEMNGFNGISLEVDKYKITRPLKTFGSGDDV